jgi:hypothetical protein
VAVYSTQFHLEINYDLSINYKDCKQVYRQSLSISLAKMKGISCTVSNLVLTCVHVNMSTEAEENGEGTGERPRATVKRRVCGLTVALHLLVVRVCKNLNKSDYQSKPSLLSLRTRYNTIKNLTRTYFWINLFMSYRISAN